VAAHLANGIPLQKLGTPFSDPVRLELPRPQQTATGWIAHIISIDTFGNLATDLPMSLLPGPENVLFRLLGREWSGISDSYGQGQAGELVAVIDSEGFIELALVNGSAAQTLDAKVGDIVEVVFGVK
jgi:S-adenosyl-L-methionine hydrolase (adenosine-forming)